MEIWRDIWRIINSAKTSTKYKGSSVSVKCSDSFKGLSLSSQTEINYMIENEQKTRAVQYCGRFDSLNDVKTRSAKLVPMVLDSWRTGRALTDVIENHITGQTATVADAISNLPTMLNVQGQDPRTMNMVTPNIWISPQEVVGVYSQKGLPETIINKKGKSPLLNGVCIKNPKLSPKQLDLIKNHVARTDFTKKIVEGLLHSLLYGGSLMFPMFKNDSPMTTSLPIDVLLRHGVIGKNCIDHWVTLDRWNCIHIPNWNPTAKDFLNPKQFYIPFLGSHVAGERCARINTSPQIGYWAVLMTLGWGISDIPGWIESVYNYHNVMSAIPTMIAQMSVLVRTLNVDSFLATEGWDILKDIDLVNTARMRESSTNNMISMDVVGDLKAVQRDFAEVPNLVRIIRQDLGGRSNIPEELLFSSDKGAFSSGDPTSGAQEKQWESIKTLHREVASQLKYAAMLLVIDALGKDRDILSALPYTTIEFDNPAITNFETKADICTKLGKAAFDFSGSGISLDIVMQIVQSYGDESLTLNAAWLEKLKAHQDEVDARTKEKHDKEIELLEAQIALTKEQADNVGVVPVDAGTTGKKPSTTGYSRLEQHQKETTRGTAARRQGLQKAAGKKL